MRHLVLWFLLSASTCFGEDSGDSAKGLYAASAKAEEDVDHKLQAAYDQLIKKITETGGLNAPLWIQRLEASQKAWKTYRETQVTFVGYYNDIGSSSARAAGMAMYYEELTKKRIDDLKEVPNPY